MDPIDSTIEPELFIPPKLILIGFVFFGMTLVLSSDYLGFTDLFKAASLGVLTQVMAVIAWKLSGWRPKLAQWFIITALVGIVFTGLVWLESPAFMALLVMPVALAAILSGLSVVIVTAIGETVLLLLGWQTALIGIDGGSMVIMLAAIWAMVGVIWAIYHPLYEVTHWSWINYRKARDLLEEVRDRKIELQQALDDLAHAYRELDLLNERVTAMRLVAEEAQAAKTVFVAKVSHEFRTPLNMIIGLTDVLMDTPEIYGDSLSPALLEDLKIVHRNCEHLSKMVNDILDLSQTEIGRLTLRREWRHLAGDIEAALTIVRPLLEKKGLALQVNLPDDLPQVYCDRTRISQVILNLVSNAARFTDQGGITLAARQQEQHLVISITDTGPGVLPEDAQRIFEPFCQGSGPSWREQHGTGLGLSISQQFVELHGGQMWLDSQPGVGSTFSFKLPLSLPTAPTVTPARWVSQDWSWHERTAKSRLPQLPYKQRLLVCDDSGDLYDVLTHCAGEIEFIRIQHLEQAIQAAQGIPAHAIVVNTNSAPHAALLLEQARKTLPDTPVIMGAFPSRTKDRSAAGVVNYLIKPIMRADLEQAIRAVGRPIQSVLIADDDPDLRQLLTRMLLIYDETLEVITASSGEQTLVQLRRSAPDLVLLDIAMPNMDGWQTLERKNQDVTIKDIPVIVISAEDPASHPLLSQTFAATIGAGMSVDKFLRCSLQLSSLLLEPD